MHSFIFFRFSKYVTLIVFFLFIKNSYADWKVIDAGINENLLSMSSSLEYGLIVGQKNIYTTTTGTTTGSNWSLFTPSGTHEQLFKQCKFYSSSEMYSNALVYICGEDTINHKAIIFSISLIDNTLTLEYTGSTGSKLNRIIYLYTTVYAVGDNGLILKQRTTPDNNANGHAFSVIQSNTTKNLYNIFSMGSSFFIAGDEVLISASYDEVTQTKICPGHTFLSITPSYYGPSLVAVTSTEIYNVNYSLDYTRYTLYDAPGLRPTSIYNSEYGMYVTSKSGIYFRKANTNYFEYQPSSLNWNLNYLRFETLYNALGVGPNGLIVYNTDNGGPTKPYARISIHGGCKNESITYTGEPGGASSISWYANGIYQSSSPTWFANFAVPGKYDIRFISSNSLYSDTVYQTIYIAEKPFINLPVSVSDAILCKSEQTSILISNTQSGYQYQLTKPYHNTTYGSVTSTGETITAMLTNNITTSGSYVLRAIHPQSGCLANFSDTIRLKVEHTKARFTSSEINTNPNTQVTFTNNSYESTFAKWTIINGTNTVHSADFSPQVSFSIPGNTLVKLVATSVNNCSDSITAPGPFVINEPYNEDCWLLQLDPMPQTTPQPVIRDVKECSDGYLVTGQYFDQDFPSRTGVVYKSHPFSGGYVAKYSHAGVLKWISYTVDSFNFSNAPFNSVTVAPNGNIYAIGSVRYHSYIFDATGDSINCGYGVNTGSADVGIIICYSPNGKILWLKQLSHVPKSVVTDHAGNLIMTGTYSPSSTIFRTFRLASQTSVTTLPEVDNSLFVNNSIPDWNGQFLLKMSPSGDFLWYTLLSNILDQDTPLSIDSHNNIFFSSHCQGFMGLFSANSDQVKLIKANPTTDGTKDNTFGFTAKYAPDGTLLWTTKLQDTRYYGSTYFTHTTIIDDHLYIMGETNGNLDYKIIQPDNSVADIHTSASFMIKLDNNGFYKWISTTEDAGNGFFTGKGLQLYKSTISNGSITVLAYIQANEDGNLVSASGSKTPYTSNSAFAFINYDHAGNILSFQSLGQNDPYYHILESGSHFFYSNKSNSIYLASNIRINPPYNLLEKTFTDTYNHFIYKISNDRCETPPVTTDLLNTVNQETQGLSIYPNPVNETSTIYIGKEGTKRIVIYDVTGKTVTDIQTDKTSYPVHALLAQSLPGMYVVQVRYDNQILTSRIIKTY